MRLSPLPLIALLLAFVFAGCGDSATGEQFDPRGSLSFTYRDPINGTFSADGELTLPADALILPGGAAAAVRRGNTLTVAAARPASGSAVDVFTLGLGDARQAGTYSFNPVACNQQGAAECRTGAFAPALDAVALGLNPSLATLAGKAYIVVLGSVRITEISARRVRGEFSGTAALANDPLHPLTIADGRFDVPIQTF
ncbi:hypothetical protein [Longimicrobium terrae]|uniref:Lipoprotein n=1 Tax=Longimicrobium terrae TaxID=1639882 RepID=A0A841H2R1_9BACT|nr:hypothetical protein [Longimicrobium terrae]MBB4637969.1 hypothetical protein [Longimicrobium terrae]MBB6072216.1 hypothetical protein [Longimicrobium terrae]NNC28358.1 hypothetical protein [Longimicrobium terrae]